MTLAFTLSVLHNFLDTLGTEEYLGISPVLLKCSLVKVLTTLVSDASESSLVASCWIVLPVLFT